MLLHHKFTGLDHADKFGSGHQFNRNSGLRHKIADALVGFDKKRMNAIAEATAAGRRRSQRMYGPRGITGFLEQFAPASLGQIFIGLGEAGRKLGIRTISIGLPHNGRQLKHLSPQFLYLRSQKQILPIRHRQNRIRHLV